MAGEVLRDCQYSAAEHLGLRQFIHWDKLGNASWIAGMIVVRMKTLNNSPTANTTRIATVVPKVQRNSASLDQSHGKEKGCKLEEDQYISGTPPDKSFKP